MNEASYIPSRLEELGDREISLIESPRDFRHNLVVDSNKNEIGKVSDLLFDIQSKKVRYLVILLHADGINLSPRKILVPVGLIHSGEKERTISIPQLHEDLINALPDYEKGRVNPGVENMIRLAFSGEGNGNETGLTGNNFLADHEDFYNHFHFHLADLTGRTKANEVNKKISGVFDDSLEAEQAVSQLIMNGFSQDDIEVSSNNQMEENEDAEQASPSTGGSVVAVKTMNTEEALKASEILDKNGSISVFEQLD